VIHLNFVFPSCHLVSLATPSPVRRVLRSGGFAAAVPHVRQWREPCT
jgi:hypothetical protein